MGEVEACDGAEAGEGREGIDEAYLTGDRTGAVDDATVAEDEDLLIALGDAFRGGSPLREHTASSATHRQEVRPRCSGRRTDPQARP